MAKLARFVPNLKNPSNNQRYRPKRKVSSPDRYQPEKYGKKLLFDPVLILILKLNISGCINTCILDDPVFIFLSEKKQEVDVPEEEEEEVQEAVQRQPTRVTVQAEVHRQGR